MLTSTQCTEKMARQGYADAQFEYANELRMRAMNAGDVAEAMAWYTKAALQDHAEAQNTLGCLYYLGHGIDQDMDKASYWYMQAAKQGHAIAQHNLSVIFAEQEDFVQSYKWSLRSAMLGYGPAQNNLSLLYFNGMGVQTDYETAMYWLYAAAKNGVAAASENLVMVAKRMEERNPAVKFISAMQAAAAFN